MQIKLLAEGGEMKPGPAISQKLGPVGIPLNEVIQKVNEATKGFKGMKVPVILDVNPSTKEFTIEVSSPPISELLKKELVIDKGSGAQKKFKCANASIEQIISVAKTKFPNLLCKDLKAAVKITLGSCVSLGILVENESPIDIIRKIEEGGYNSEISQEKTETPGEKKKLLDEFFSKLKIEQDKKLKIEKEAEKEAEDKKSKGSKEKTEKPKEPKK